MPKAAIDIGQMSPQERLDLIERLWDSLADEDVPLTDPQREELELRLAALDREGPVGIPWEHILHEMGGSPK